jgi:hypothetical protein
LVTHGVGNAAAEGNERLRHPVASVNVSEIKQCPGLPPEISRTKETSLRDPIPPTTDHVCHLLPVTIRPPVRPLVIRQLLVSLSYEFIQASQDDL